MGFLHVLLLASLLEPATLGESYTSIEILITDVVNFLFFFLCIFLKDINQV